MSLLSYVLLLWALISCEKTGHLASPTAVPVTGMRIVAQTIPADFTFVAIAESSHIVEIRARVEGYLEKIAYTEGGVVQAGNLLFVIDQHPFMAALEAAKGDLARQKALLWDKAQEKARMFPLYNQHAVSQRDLDTAISDDLAAQANVMIAEANVDKAAINLGYCSIKAPVTGLVSLANFREGALISPGSNNLLTTLYVIDPIWITMNFSEATILQVREQVEKKLLQLPEGNNFSIELLFRDGTVFPSVAKINFIAPNLQQSTGTALIRTTAPNPEGLILPGMFLRAIMKGAIRPNAIIVPQTAVQQGQTASFVYVVDQNGKASLRPVTLGDWYKDFWVVTSGLQSGDIVIAEGANRVQNNTPVHVVRWLESSPTP